MFSTARISGTTCLTELAAHAFKLNCRDRRGPAKADTAAGRLSVGSVRSYVRRPALVWLRWLQDTVLTRLVPNVDGDVSRRTHSSHQSQSHRASNYLVKHRQCRQCVQSRFARVHLLRNTAVAVLLNTSTSKTDSSRVHNTESRRRGERKVQVQGTVTVHKG